MDGRGEFHLIRTTYNPQSYRRRQSSYQNASSDPRRSESSNWRVRSESSSMRETSDPYLHKTTNTNSQKGQMRNEVPIYNSQMLNAAGYMNLDDRIARGPRMASDGRPMVVSTQNAGKINNSVNIPPVNQNPSSQTMKSSAMGRVTNNSSKRAQVIVPVENREVVGIIDNNKNVRNIPEVQKNCQDKGKSIMGSVEQAPAAPKPFPRSNQVVGTMNNNKNVPNIPEVQKNCQDKGKSVMGSVDQAPTMPKPIPRSNQVVGKMDNTKNVHNIPEVQKNCQDKGKSVMGSVDQAPEAPKPFPQSFHLTRNGFPLIYRIEGANWTYAPLKEFTRVSSEPNPNPEQQGKTPGSSAANETTGERMVSSGQNPPITSTPYDSFTMGPMKEALRYAAYSRDVFLFPELYLPADLSAELNM